VPAPAPNPLPPPPPPHQIRPNPLPNIPQRTRRLDNGPNDTNQHADPDPEKGDDDPAGESGLGEDVVRAKQGKRHDGDGDDEERGDSYRRQSLASLHEQRVHGLDLFCFEEVDDFVAGWDGGFGVGEGGAVWLVVFACTADGGGGGGGVGLLRSRRGESDAVDFMAASDVVRVGGVEVIGEEEGEDEGGEGAAGGAGDVACHGIDGVAGGEDGDGAAAGGGGDEPGGQAEGEADPGREADGGRRDARPQEHQAGGDGASADDDAEDGQEPGQIELDDV